MSNISTYERQRREVNAYNLFYSSLTARATPSLSTHGVRLPVMFPVIEDRTQGIEAEPDFVLYDGDTCMMSEIKSGSNIGDRDIQQMEGCSSLDIETVESFLRDAQVHEKTRYDGSVNAVEVCIVYQDLNEEYVEKYRKESTAFKNSLNDITNHAVLMTQDYGAKLRVLEGEFNTGGTLPSLLSRGVELPENPPDEIMLTEGMENEILAVAICDIWGERVVDYEDPIEVSREEVRDYFAPRHNIPPGDLDLVFEFLTEIEACDHVDGHIYEFSRDNIDQIISIESIVREHRVDEFLRGEAQAQLDRFDTGDDDGDGE